MLLYYITDRRQFAGDEPARQRQLLKTIAAAAEGGVDYIELREPDLPAGTLVSLTRAAVEAVGAVNRRRVEAGIAARPTRLLVHERLDVALAAGADGVFLPGDGLNAADARTVWHRAGHFDSRGAGHFDSRGAGLFVAGCRTAGELRMAEAQGADLAVVSAVEGAAGLAELCAACAGLPSPSHVEAGMPAGRMAVLAACDTPEAAALYRAAGAAGVAFQTGDPETAIDRLRVGPKTGFFR